MFNEEQKLSSAANWLVTLKFVLDFYENRIFGLNIIHNRAWFITNVLDFHYLNPDDFLAFGLFISGNNFLFSFVTFIVTVSDESVDRKT